MLFCVETDESDGQNRVAKIIVLLCYITLLHLEIERKSSAVTTSYEMFGRVSFHTDQFTVQGRLL